MCEILLLAVYFFCFISPILGGFAIHEHVLGLRFHHADQPGHNLMVCCLPFFYFENFCFCRFCGICYFGFDFGTIDVAKFTSTTDPNDDRSGPGNIVLVAIENYSCDFVVVSDLKHVVVILVLVTSKWFFFCGF